MEPWTVEQVARAVECLEQLWAIGQFVVSSIAFAFGWVLFGAWKSGMGWLHQGRKWGGKASGD